METPITGDPLEEFSSIIRRMLSTVEEKSRGIAEIADELIRYAREDPFSNPEEFYTLLYRLDSACSELTEYLEAVEVRLEELRLKAGIREEPRGEDSREEKRSILERLGLKRRGQGNPGTPRNPTPTVEYGRNLASRLDFLLSQYMKHYYLVKIQDEGSRGVRWEHERLQLLTALTDLVSDVKKYALAALSSRRAELEAKLERIASTILKAEAGS